ncbi:MAG: hypothetical protein EBR01_07825 [Proteobacteria bacterium]|nr:hypothetical protein [Pseudomonadota bacterium]
MSLKLKTVLIVIGFLLITSCGKEAESSRLNRFQSQFARRNQSTCPLKFASSGLCSEMNWTSGPSVEKESSFTITFWSEKDGSSTGPWVEPSAQVGAFIRMTCCGSVFFPKVTKVEPGKYSVTNVKFTPGKWEVYVQLKSGDVVEKQFLTIQLDD